MSEPQSEALQREVRLFKEAFLLGWGLHRKVGVLVLVKTFRAAVIGINAEFTKFVAGLPDLCVLDRCSVAMVLRHFAHLRAGWAAGGADVALFCRCRSTVLASPSN
jgi:hypothetical protein